MVFQYGPEKRLARGQLDDAQLARTIQGSLGQHLIQIELFAAVGSQKNTVFDFDKAHRIDDAHVSMIDVVLAAHGFQRTHGEFPATMEQLVPDFLDVVPFDPMSDDGAPLNYLRDVNGEAMIWSLGLDGKDDGGDIEGKEPKDRGYRIRLIQELVRESIENNHVEERCP